MIESVDICSCCKRQPLAYIENHKESAGYGWCNTCSGWFRPWQQNK